MDNIHCLKQILNSINTCLSTENLQLLASKCKFATVKKGGIITRVNTIETNIYFLKKGVVEYSREQEKNKEVFKQTTQITPSKNIIGELESFILQKPSKYTITALNDLELIYVSNHDLKTLYEINNNFKDIVLSIVNNEYVKKKEREFNLLTKTAEELYFDLVNKSPKVIKETPLNILSSYLGITPQSLSRIRKKSLACF